ncbi:MAG TPA: hypothetical protein VH593_10095, partial [Ktedonobacteraceae bacterium]
DRMPQPHSWCSQVWGEWRGGVIFTAASCRSDTARSNPIAASKESIASWRAPVKQRRKDGLGCARFRHG